MSNPETSPPSGRRPMAPAVGLVICAVVAFSWVVVGQRFWIDDSFISFRYARQLVEGNGLVYNQGDPIEGYTNFLWTLVAALGQAFGLAPIHFTQGVSLVALGGTMWCAYRLGLLAAPAAGGGRVLIAPLLVGTSFGLVAYPMCGMETSFFTMLVALAALGLRAGWHERVRGGVALGVALLALALTRFDGFVPVILLTSYPLLFGGGRSRRALLAPLTVFLVGVGAYNLWRITYYPTVLPNTFHAKTGFSPDRVVVGLRYLGSFLLGPGGLFFALGLLPFVLRRASSTARHLGWVVLGQGGYAAMVGGDWMPHFRFLIPMLPLLFVLVAEGLGALAERLPGPLRTRSVGVGAVALLLVPGITQVATGLAELEPQDTHFRPHDARRIGLHLAEHLPPESRIAVEWGGIIPYYTPHWSLDTWGLTDRAIVDHGFRKMVWGRKITARYLASRRPDLIVPCAHLMSTEAAARESIQPEGVNHYSYYPRMDSESFGYEWKVFRIADDAWWPALVRRAAAGGAAAGTAQ